MRSARCRAWRGRDDRSRAFVALQLAATLVVRDAHRTVRVPLVSTASGPMLRPESIGDMLPIGVHHDSASAYTLDVWGVRLQLEVGVALVRMGDDVRQLATAPVLRSGHLFVPLQLISEVFPTTVPNTRWDADAAQLVVFTTATSAGEVTSSSARAPEPRVVD